MNKIAIDLGFVQIYWYSITMLLGVIFGSLLTYTELKRLKMNGIKNNEITILSRYNYEETYAFR